MQPGIHRFRIRRPSASPASTPAVFGIIPDGASSASTPAPGNAPSSPGLSSSHVRRSSASVPRDRPAAHQAAFSAHVFLSSSSSTPGSSHKQQQQQQQQQQPLPQGSPLSDSFKHKTSPQQQQRPSESAQTTPPTAATDPSSLRSARRPPRRIPACDRCRSFKKKCSRTFPACALCQASGHACSLARGGEAQVAQLRARIAWLSRYVNEAVLPAGHAGIEAVETGAELQLVQHAEMDARMAAYAAAAAAGGSASGGGSPFEMSVSPGEQQAAEAASILASPQRKPPVSVAGSVDGQSVTGSVCGTSTAGGVRSPLEPTVARRLVDAFFRHVNRAYPFVSRSAILRQLDVLVESQTHSHSNSHSHSHSHPHPHPHSPTSPFNENHLRRAGDADSTLLYLVMAIGCTTLQRAGQIAANTLRFEIDYAQIVQECLATQDIKSVQILVLLSLSSIFDPSGVSPWSIVGIVSRQALLLGLSRRSDNTAASHGLVSSAQTGAIPAGSSAAAAAAAAANPTSNELRHRLLWSIYNLDRMAAMALGLPPALVDQHIDVPLPSLTLEEMASSERSQWASMLQTSRHVIELRRLEDRVLSHRRPMPGLSLAERRAVLHELRADIENWYSSGCLLAPLEPDNVPIHNSITWLSARYYNLLLHVFYPSPLNPFARLAPRHELLSFAQKHLQATAALHAQRQLPLNRITLCRLFPAGLVLMHSVLLAVSPLAAGGGSSGSGGGSGSGSGSGSSNNNTANGAGSATAPQASPLPMPPQMPAREEIATLVSICEAFPPSWTAAAQAAHLFRRFKAVLMAPSGAFDTAAQLVCYGQGLYLGQQQQQQPNQAKDIRSQMKPLIVALLGLMKEVLGQASFYVSYDVPAVDEEWEELLAVEGTMTDGVSTGGAAASYTWGTLDLDFL